MAFKNLALFFLLGLVSIHGLPIALENDAAPVAPAAPVADVAEPVKDAEVPVENVSQESKPESEPNSDDQKFIFPIFSMGFPSMGGFSQPAPTAAPPPPPPPPQPEIVFIPPNSQISVISQGTPIQIQQSSPIVVNVPSS